MPVVQETVRDSANRVARDVQIDIVLIASTDADGNAPGYGTKPTTILGRWRTWTGADGTWSADLLANSTLVPANTYYALSRKGGGVRSDEALLVPNGAGPYWVDEVLTMPPTALPTWLSDSVSLALASSALAGTGSQVSRADHVHPTTGLATAIRPQDFGAVANGVTDCTAAIQAAIDAAAATGAPVYVPPGNYVVSATLGRNSVTGLVFTGSGASITARPGAFGSGTGALDSLGTRFTWQGNATSPMFRFGDLRSSVLERFAIGCSVSFPLLCGIELYSLASSAQRGNGTTPTRNTLNRISMDGISGYLKYGVRWPGAASDNPPASLADANNDFTTLQFVEVANHGGVGFSIDHSQAYNQLFIQCTVNGASNLTGQAGISCGAIYNGSTWAETIGGTFIWHGGAMGRHQQADIVFGTPQSSGCILDGMNSENSVRLISFPAASSTTGLNNGGPMLLRGVRYAHNSFIASDKYFIDFHAPGPLVLQGCEILDQGAGNALKIRLVAGTSGLQTLRVQDSYIQSTAADNDMYDLAGSNTANSKVYISGNRRLDLSNANAVTRWTDE